MSPLYAGQRQTPVMTATDYLVPDRECGACTVCCKDLAIVEDGLDKRSGELCEHCTIGKGCSIYATRPPVCRTYYCLWRRLPFLDDDWRPDLSGILIVPDTIPDDFVCGFAVNVVLVGPPDILRDPRFAGMIAGLIESGTATSLNVPAGPGMLTYKSRLNEELAPAIAARNLPHVQSLIWQCYAALAALPPKPVPDEVRQTH
jgi:hypothetical protein